MAKDPSAYSIELNQHTFLLHIPDWTQYAAHHWDTERHCNAEYELHILLQGSCMVEIEEQNIRLGERQVLLIAPGQYHRPNAAGALLRCSVSFSVADPSLAKALRSAVPSYRLFPLHKHLEQIFHTLRYENASVNPYRREMLQSLTTQLMILIVRELGLPIAAQDTSSTTTERSRTALIDSFFEQHFADRAGKQELAQLLHLSERQLTRVLLDSYGMSYQTKLICARMDHAACLLRSGAKQIGEIAWMVGYGSEAAFFQAFRKHFHCTPQQYRNKFKKDHPDRSA